MARGLEITADDRIAMVFPIAHIGGCAVWFTCSLLCGATLIFTEYVEPDSVCDLLRDHHVTIAGTGPAHHAMYLAAQRAHPGAPYFPDVRVYTSGGAAKPPSHFAMIERELGRPVHSSYGMTEAPILTCTRLDDPDEVLAGSEGRANEGVEIRIVDGEVRVKGPQVMRGYLDSSLDADAFDDEGWLRSGDLGTLDPAGNLTITGRIKDVIIRKGETFSAREVEDLLITAPGVADVAVIGLPHPVLGEQACACVVAADPSDPPTLEALTAHLAEQGLMRQKWPERLQILDSLPRNLAGKVVKADLRALVG
jgi:acyl-CoA synthetase (AMP-forming)/AMP-acid ligase II